MKTWWVIHPCPPFKNPYHVQESSGKKSYHSRPPLSNVPSMLVSTPNIRWRRHTDATAASPLAWLASLFSKVVGMCLQVEFLESFLMLQWGATWGRLITFCCSQVLRQGVGRQAPQSPEAVTLEPSSCLGARENPFATTPQGGQELKKSPQLEQNAFQTWFCRLDRLWGEECQRSGHLHLGLGEGMILAAQQHSLECSRTFTRMWGYLVPLTLAFEL